MESLIIQRISSILDHNKVTKQNLANEINMNQTALGRQIKGEQALSAKLIEGFLHVFPDISAEWLLRGEGDMYKSNSGSPQFEAASYGHNEIWYRGKTYAGLVFDDIYFGFQADINRTYFNKYFFVRKEKNVQSCKHFLHILLSKLKVKYDTEMHEEFDENGFYYAWGGHSPTSEEDIGFRVFVVKDKIYQIFLTYGDYDYINEEF